MINLMRKNQRTLMLIISILTIVSFVWLYNRTDVDKLSKATFAIVYGKPVGGPEVDRMARQLRVAYSMGLQDLVQNLAGRSSKDSEEEYVWNTMVLRHVASELQIEPSVESIKKRELGLPVFQSNGQFDIGKFNDFVTNLLTPQGYTTQQMDDLVRDDLRLARLKELVGSTVAVASSEMHDAFADAFQKRHVSFVRLKREDFSKAVTVSPAEIQEYFDKNKDSFKTEEKRVIRYVAFALPEKDQKLKDKELVAALKPLMTKAEEFSQKMVEPGAKIDEVAAKLEATIQVTPAFTSSNPPPELANIPTFTQTAFGLTPEAPDSDVLQTETAYYIVHLDKIEPSQPETLEQATPKITATLTDEKTAKAMTARATELKKQFAEAVRSGKTFAQAAEAAGMKAESIAPFSQAEPGDDMTNREVMMQAAELQLGAVSDLIETQDGGEIAFVEKIDPLDESIWEKRKSEVMERYTSGKRDLNFTEWLRVQRQLADVRPTSR